MAIQHNISLKGNIGLINIENMLSNNTQPSNLINISGGTWFMITEYGIKRFFTFKTLLDNFIEKSYTIQYDEFILDTNNNVVSQNSDSYRSLNIPEYDFFYTVDSVNGKYGDDIRKRVINGFLKEKYGVYCFNQLVSGATFYQPILFTGYTTPAGNDSSGTINIGITDGGDSPEYSLDNITWQSSNVFSGLDSGTYTIYIRNIYGVQTSSTVTVD